MKNNKKLLVLILAFVLLLGGASVLYTRLSGSVATQQLSSQEAAQGSPQEPSQEASQEPAPDAEALPMAPDFTVYDAEGNEVKLSDYFGTPIVLNFWASWCGPCQMEMPDFHEKYLELEGEVQFLMINSTDGSRETVESASAFLEENGYTFPVFYDTQSDAAITYGAYSLPTTFFIDAEGHAIAQAVGPIDAELLQTGIDMIL